MTKCKRTAAKYLSDLAKNKDICQQLNMTDVESMKDSGYKVEGDHSVCKYLVGYANSVNAPSSWAKVFEYTCLMVAPLYGLGYCERTVAKYMGDFKTNPDQFCSELNLVDV